jgi:hypothetical protein
MALGQERRYWPGTQTTVPRFSEASTTFTTSPIFQRRLVTFERLKGRSPSYLGSLLASFILISGLSYKTTFNKELWISIFPLYSI